MGHVVAFEAADGAMLLVEVADPVAESKQTTRGLRQRDADLIRDVGSSLDEVFDRIRAPGDTLVRRLRQGIEPPTEVELEFGIRLSAEGNVIIARASGETNFRIVLRWRSAEHVSAD